MRRLLVLLVLSILVSGHASAMRVGVYADPAGTDYHIDDTPGLVKLYVVAYPTVVSELTAIEFAAPVPACVTGAIWLSDETVFPIVVGSSQVGVSIGLGGCEPAPVHVLTINVFMQGLTTGCCYYNVFPHPSAPSGQIEFVDCSSTVRSGFGSYALVANRALSDPSPQDMSTNQSLNSTLSWNVNLCDDGHDEIHSVYFGTDPTNPPLVATIPVRSYDPGPLAPNTVYYWKIVSTGWYNVVEGPIWSFGTEGPVPVERTTWGAIKGLFRD